MLYIMDTSVTGRGEVGEEEWELSKENVQPLRQGRKFANLSAALQPHTTDQIVKLKEQRQLFETELRSYNGNDPLYIWHRYIQWTEQNFPKGGKESNIQQLIENCITTFKDDTRYKNDTRLIDIWIKFTSYCTDPLEIYSFLFNQGIGCSLARFYDTWASELEKLGNTKKADLIYIRGIENGAEPLDLLKRQHSEFQARVARGVAGHMTEDVAGETADQGASEPHRMALGQLKAKGKKAQAPVNRTGIPIRHGATGGGLLAPHAQGSNSRQTFAVFADENVVPTAMPAQTRDWQTVPGKEAHRENEQGPGRWTGARMKQRHQPVIPVSELTSHSKLPDFAVHQDETPETPVAMPRKVPGDQVLSARKAGNDVDPSHILRIGQTGSTCETMSMYDKHKVYAGVNEFSFEEIRGADWFKHQQLREEKRLEEEQRRELELRNKQQELRSERLEQTVQEQHRMIQQLRQNQEMLASMVAAAKSQQPDAPTDRCVKQAINTSSQNSSIRGGSSNAGQIQSGASFNAENSLRRGASFSAENSLRHGASFSAENSLRHGASFSAENSLRHGASFSAENSLRHVASFSAENSLRHGASFSAENSLRQEPSFRGPLHTNAARSASGGRLKDSSSVESSVLSTSAHASVESSLNSSSSLRGQGRNMSRSGWLSAPSPTVNTKEAMMVVQNMFNVTLPGISSADDTRQLEASYALNRDDGLTHFPAASAMPFTVFEESHVAEPEEKYAQEVVMESDKENWLQTAHKMAPPKRAGLKAVLQPAEGTPFEILDEQLCAGIEPERQQHEGTQGAMETRALEPHRGQQLIDQEDEAMDGIEVTCGNYDVAIGDDITFAPTSCSTQNFTAAARLASTPFNNLANMAPLPEPPLSVIRPAAETTGATRVQQQSEHPGSTDATSSNDSSDKRHSEQFSIYVGQENNLSTIMEGSSEGKSHSSASSGGSTTCGGATTVEWSRHCSQSTNNVTADQSKKVSDESHAFAAKFERMLDCTTHNIDTTNYVPAYGDISMAADPFDMSIAINPNDPFDEDLVAEFLSRLVEPIETRPNFHKKQRRFPDIVVGLINVLGDDAYQVDSMLGEGAYAKVYQATRLDECSIDEGEHKVLKVQKPACRWEFYIVTELQQRLANLNADIDVSPSVMSIDRAYFYRDGSCLVSDLHKYGTLLELVNAGKRLGKPKPQSEMVSICLVIEMLHIVEQMHRCNIIHSDIKPDNFLLRGLKPLADARGPAEMLAGHTRALQLIDFGRSIDMTMFLPGTTFMVKVETDGFQCIEMKTDRPWTYQTDLFGIIGTVHVLLFGKYMHVYPEAGHWRTTNTFKRYWVFGELWQSLFDSLLNIPSCEELPDLAALRYRFERAFIDNVVWTDFCKEIEQLEDMLQSM